MEKNKTNIGANISTPVLRKIIQVTSGKNKKPVDDSVKTSLISAGLSGLTAAGLSSLLFKKKPAIMIANIIGAGGAGYAIPQIINKVRSEKNKKDTEATKKYIHGIMTSSSEISEVGVKHNFPKKAGFISEGVGGVFGLAGKGLGLSLKTVGRGLLPAGKNAPLGQKVFGWGVKGAAGYGIYRGGKHIAERRIPNEFGNPNPTMSGNNYTTFLRNNVMAGKINPGELSEAEVQAVKGLGMY